MTFCLPPLITQPSDQSLSSSIRLSSSVLGLGAKSLQAHQNSGFAEQRSERCLKNKIREIEVCECSKEAPTPSPSPTGVSRGCGMGVPEGEGQPGLEAWPCIFWRKLASVWSHPRGCPSRPSSLPLPVLRKQYFFLQRNNPKMSIHMKITANTNISHPVYLLFSFKKSEKRKKKLRLRHKECFPQSLC